MSWACPFRGSPERNQLTNIVPNIILVHWVSPKHAPPTRVAPKSRKFRYMQRLPDLQTVQPICGGAVFLASAHVHPRETCWRHRKRVRRLRAGQSLVKWRMRNGYSFIRKVIFFTVAAGRSWPGRGRLCPRTRLATIPRRSVRTKFPQKPFISENMEFKHHKSHSLTKQIILGCS